MRLFLSLLNRYDIIPLPGRSSSVDVAVERPMQMMNTSSQSTTMIVTSLTRMQRRKDFIQGQFWTVERRSLNFNPFTFSIPDQIIDGWRGQCCIMQ